jgi:hypothetical protein
MFIEDCLRDLGGIGPDQLRQARREKFLAMGRL